MEENCSENIGGKIDYCQHNKKFTVGSTQVLINVMWTETYPLTIENKTEKSCKPERVLDNIDKSCEIKLTALKTVITICSSQSS